MKILLSIKPEFVEKIISGEKKFEFRKTLPKRVDVTTVVVYSTMPVGKVVGEFKVKDTHSYEPESLWEKTKDFSGITKHFFDEYFSTKSLAHAFEIDSFELYQEPKHISEVIRSGTPPQSYCYLT
ncbi:ASCH domain-containing protein [Mannheimia varigena]|uniref:ASCH domain-containing protein n=1 Tax=Mannheimia varigena TaxID=85404 RepID=UPI00110670F7|nr:ASCH domain-containing protein [Mannheimia varigena]TLU75377.1 ASCH domain-containing protein [Mannheimia varigena]